MVSLFRHRIRDCVVQAAVECSKFLKRLAKGKLPAAPLLDPQRWQALGALRLG